MKIRIISIHDIGTNFGSTLQACSLYDYINSLGYGEVKVINYKPKYAYHHGKFGQFVKKMLFAPAVIKQNKRFKKYYQEHCNLTPLYEIYEELEKEKEADAFIVGSDQVWNEYYDGGRDLAYYLAFTNCKYKMSYSASVGQIQSKEAIERLVERIKDFKYVAVREEATIPQLYEAGRTDVIHVLDPVFLQEKEYYLDNNFDNKYGKYILVYVVHSDPFLDRMVTKIANIYGAKIVLVGGFVQKVKHDYYLRDIGPKEFVNLIHHAEFVVANSFHATAFSILLNKQFALINPRVSPLRLSDMLETAGIENRIISSEGDLQLALEYIDYTKVNVRIEKMKKTSKDYIKNSLDSFVKEMEQDDK